MSKEMDTKELIMEAASELFNAKGYQGTTIRDIAKKAKVNTANISYYFEGKQGLLEACIISFFEPYLLCLEEEMAKLDTESPELCLKRAIRNVLCFQSEHHLLARFVWREVTIDSQMSREIISSYLMKERFFFKTLIGSTLKEKNVIFPLSMMIIQLKGMLMMPYLNSQYVSEVWGVLPQEPYFAEKYFRAVKQWLDTSIGTKHAEIVHLSPIRQSV